MLELEGTAVPAEHQGRKVPFELKSATKGTPTISTVRDLGAHHIEKWRKLHWIFGVYSRNAQGDQVLQYCLYGSPALMARWFQEQLDYVIFDDALAKCVPPLIGYDVLTIVLGDARAFSVDVARRLMKRQVPVADLLARADLPNGSLSRKAMLGLLRRRAGYLAERGATRNNPHIPASYFDGWEEIRRNHASRLRELVLDALKTAE